MQTAWVSVMSPNGNIIREDFGYCPLAKYPEPYANLGAMTVVRDRLYVAGEGKICVFNTFTYETLPPIGEVEFAGYLLSGLGYSERTDALWVTSTGYDLRTEEPDGRQMIASIELRSRAATPILKHVNFHGEMAYLFPKAVAVDKFTGDLYVTSMLEYRAHPSASALYRCKEVYHDYTGSLSIGQPLDCAPVSAAVVIRQDVGLHGAGVVIDSAGLIYFSAFNSGASKLHLTGASYIFRLSGTSKEFLESLVVDGPTEHRLITPSEMGYDSQRDRLVVPSFSSSRYYTVDLKRAAFLPFQNPYAIPPPASHQVTEQQCLQCLCYGDCAGIRDDQCLGKCERSWNNWWFVVLIPLILCNLAGCVWYVRKAAVREAIEQQAGLREIAEGAGRDYGTLHLLQAKTPRSDHPEGAGGGQDPHRDIEMSGRPIP
eukprot:CAMPEP_0198204214 /NCGR_PEP_ID=MMETSP1445-20131203/7603_1 /TAXON_ID=36898 /ORGANISM="Pyramimonas sp., Strain CCMP2087" /LENGTH=428 /DNA_ID=CAMNT_0043875985 /DNA_START=394 /DNA_END=1680 /DNA_ORIENTATION=-